MPLPVPQDVPSEVFRLYSIPLGVIGVVGAFFAIASTLYYSLRAAQRESRLNRITTSVHCGAVIASAILCLATTVTTYRKVQGQHNAYTLAVLTIIGTLLKQVCAFFGVMKTVWVEVVQQDEARNLRQGARTTADLRSAPKTGQRLTLHGRSKALYMVSGIYGGHQQCLPLLLRGLVRKSDFSSALRNLPTNAASRTQVFTIRITDSHLSSSRTASLKLAGRIICYLGGATQFFVLAAWLTHAFVGRKWSIWTLAGARCVAAVGALATYSVGLIGLALATGNVWGVSDAQGKAIKYAFLVGSALLTLLVPGVEVKDVIVEYSEVDTKA